MKKIVTLIEGDLSGDLILPLDDEIFAETGWKIGDTIKWTDNGDGSWTMSKVEEDKQLVLVETVVMHRRRYLIETPKGHADYALDDVVCGEAPEFCEDFLDEVIVTHRVVDNEEAQNLYNECGMIVNRKDENE